MKAYDPSDLLISIHVPKCGGSSLKAALKSWFGKKLYYHYFDEEKNAMPSKTQSYKIKLLSMISKGYCVHGHFNRYRGFGVKDYYPGAKQFMSFVRDPLEVQLSNYYFVNKKILYREGDRFHLKMHIKEYLENVIKGGSWYMAHFPDNLDESSIVEYFESRFIFLGVMEEYQKSLDILAGILDKPKFEIPAYNVTERDSHDLDEDLISRFREAFKLDYLIYDYAKKYIDSF